MLWALTVQEHCVVTFPILRYDPAAVQTHFLLFYLLVYTNNPLWYQFPSEGSSDLASEFFDFLFIIEYC